MNGRACLIWVFLGAIFAGSAMITFFLIELRINFLTALLYSMPFIVAGTFAGGFACYRLSLRRTRLTT